jgi:hypothetical protein
MTNKQKAGLAVAIVLVPALLLWGFNALVLQPQIAEFSAEARGLGPIKFTNPVQMAQTLSVAGDATVAGDMSVSGDLTASSIVTDGVATLTTLETTGNITSAGSFIGTLGTAAQPSVTSLGVLSALNVSGNVVVTGTQLLIGQTTESTNIIHSSASITPTDGGVLTPTAKLVTLTPAGAVGVSLAACTTGMETILYNSVNANVVITDTGNGLLAGNQTLGQYDSLMLTCFATKWVQVGAVSAN